MGSWASMCCRGVWDSNLKTMWQGRGWALLRWKGKVKAKGSGALWWPASGVDVSVLGLLRQWQQTRGLNRNDLGVRFWPFYLCAGEGAILPAENAVAAYSCLCLLALVLDLCDCILPWNIFWSFPEPLPHRCCLAGCRWEPALEAAFPLALDVSVLWCMS